MNYVEIATIIGLLLGFVVGSALTWWVLHHHQANFCLYDCPCHNCDDCGHTCGARED